MRNHPEQYIAVLKEHFADIPPIICARQPKELIISKPSDITTNQHGKITAFQRWFNFKEAFAPSFVMAAIESLGYKPTHIIDPFGGSGTTAITAQLLDINATTIEINPFIADLITAKATPISAERLRTTSTEFSAKLLTTSANLERLSHLPPTFIEDKDKDRWIFPKEVALRITQYLAVIDSYPDLALQRLFKIVLGSVLVPVSNVYVNGKGRRYRRNWKSNQSTASTLDDLFIAQLNVVIEDSLRFEHRPDCQVRVYNGDSRTSLADVSEPADLIVFSPPYPNSFDYTDIYNVELWILGYLETSEQNTVLRGQTLRSHVQVRRLFDKPNNMTKSLLKAYQALDEARPALWNKNIPEMVTAYFRDLEEILVNSLRLLKPKGKVIIVVGDSKYSNVHINVADILTEIAKEIGFKNISKNEVRKMRASAQQGGTRQLGEWIIELSHKVEQ